jgi:hypothetical protein
MKLNIKKFSLLFSWTVHLPFFRILIAWGEMCFIKRGWRLDASLRFAFADRHCFARSRLVPRLTHVYCYYLAYLPCNIYIYFSHIFHAFCLLISSLLVPAPYVFVETWYFQGVDDLDCILVGSYQNFGRACFLLLGSGFCHDYGERMILWSSGDLLQN